MALKPLHIQIILSCSSSLGAQILEGASRFAREMAHVRLMVSTQIDANVDGILSALHTPQLIQHIKNTNLPAVNLTDIQANPVLPTVMGDNYAMGKVAAEYLIGRGYHHLALYGWNKVPKQRDTRFGAKRFWGFSKTLEDHGKTFIMLHPKAEHLQWKTHLQQLCVQLGALPKPIAIWCEFDQLGANLLYACRELGLSIPDEVGILGLGDEFPICEICEPGISSVDSANVQRGYLGMSMLTDWIEKQTRPPKNQLLQPVGVTERGSTNAIHFTDVHLRQTMRWITEHLADDLHIEKLLEHVPISRRSLEIKCRLILGESLAQVIRKARLNRGRELLVDTSQSINEIASRCGYQNSSAFSAAFVRQFDCKPSTYRTMLGKI